VLAPCAYKCCALSYMHTSFHLLAHGIQQKLGRCGIVDKHWQRNLHLSWQGAHHHMNLKSSGIGAGCGTAVTLAKREERVSTCNTQRAHSTAMSLSATLE